MNKQYDDEQYESRSKGKPSRDWERKTKFRAIRKQLREQKRNGQ